MTSILGTQSIQHPNGTAAATVGATGIITQPLKPGFSAYRSSALTVSNTMTTIVFNTAIHNQGNHYNTSNGFFTAPVTGLYYFSAAIAIQVNHDNRYFNIYLQNSDTNYSGQLLTGRAHTNTTAGTTYGSTHLEGVVPLNASDTTRIKFEIENSSTTYYQDKACYFTGFLVG